MRRLFLLGYGLIGVGSVFWVSCGSPRSLEHIYSSSVSELPEVESPSFSQDLSDIWSLAHVDLQERLPDLSREIIFLGKNKRPDATGQFFLQLASSKDVRVSHSGERVYLCADVSSGQAVFTFSPQNLPTHLWIECRALGGSGDRLEVKVRLLDGYQQLVTTPVERSVLCLASLPQRVEEWKIGGVSVDASFPVKQKMRRMGKDAFLLMHGGEDHAHCTVKERVDFASLSGENYIRYLEAGDILLWDGDRWQMFSQFQGESAEVPLLEVKKVEDKVMSLELWNVGGTAHQTINLVKMVSSPIEMSELVKEFEFVGMRSWSCPILQVGGQRLLLFPNDWVVYCGERWERIVCKEQLESFLSGKTQGPLFVFDTLEKEGSRFVLQGHVFNGHRTLVESVRLPLKQDFEVVDPAAESHMRGA